MIASTEIQYTLAAKVFVVVDLRWTLKIIDKLINRPKTSDASQFHQPPQVPSCKAHQLPKKSANTFI
jgi:hypothetical protein